jgi:tetratricopeptide (TPR) repeat protein
MERQKTLSQDAPIAVLEMASGVGLFALNFLRTFEDIDMGSGTKFRNRLKYYFTDFSEENLLNAAAIPALKQLKNDGVLEFAVLDALSPDTMRILGQEKHIPVPPLCAIIANYLHCCLPASILKKSGDTPLREKHIRLSLNVPATVKDPGEYAKQFVEHPVGEKVIEQLVEDVSWHDITHEFFADPLHEEVIKDGTKEYKEATILYPRGSFASVQRSLPLLERGGVIIISDKGYPSPSYMEGEGACGASIHGNSFAHALNFPLLEILAKKLGHSSIRTTEPTLALHTILIEKRSKSELLPLFFELFISENQNVDSSDFYAAAQKYEESKEFDKASRFYRRAIPLRKYDAHVYFSYGNCLQKTKDYLHAVDILSQGKQFDHFREYDFDFRIGYAYHMLGDYTKAVASYRTSAGLHASDATFYNIGLCLEKLDDTAAAMESYREALKINPAYTQASDALRKLDKQ